MSGLPVRPFLLPRLTPCDGPWAPALWAPHLTEGPADLPRFTQPAEVGCELRAVCVCGMTVATQRKNQYLSPPCWAAFDKLSASLRGLACPEVSCPASPGSPVEPSLVCAQPL